ncbi:MAG: cytochrome c oxidase assembly protein, partial [Solirubrobacteraceae bacterium]
MVPSVSPSIQWTFEPSVLAGVGILTVVYGLAWRRARASGSPHRPGWGRLALFASGLLAILVALVSPMDGLADQLLLMHMVQHVVLLDAVPILLILGTNKVLLRPVTRRLHMVERRAGFLAHPAFAVFF